MHDSQVLEAEVNDKFPWSLYKDALISIVEELSALPEFSDFVTCDFTSLSNYSNFAPENLTLSDVKALSNSSICDTATLVRKTRSVFTNALRYWHLGDTKFVRLTAFKGLDTFNDLLQEKIPGLFACYTGGGRMSLKSLKDCRIELDSLIYDDPNYKTTKRLLTQVSFPGSPTLLDTISNLNLQDTYASRDSLFNDVRSVLDGLIVKPDFAKYQRKVSQILQKISGKPASNLSIGATPKPNAALKLEGKEVHLSKITQYFIVSELVKLDSEGNFHKPAVELHPDIADSYLMIIKQPMDFGTIRNNVESGLYSSSAAFKNDIELVFQNCQSFNKGNPYFEELCAALQGRFIALYSDPFPEKVHCKKLLTKIMEKKNAIIFNEPVDWKALQMLDYPDIIKAPMDFRTIKGKLESNQYSKSKYFFRDISLVFSNCRTYNVNNPTITNLCDALELSIASLCASLNLLYGKTDLKVTIPVSKSPVSTTHFPKKQCTSIILAIKKLPASNIFHKPVSHRDFPTYGDIIKHPMDIKTLWNNVKSGIYATKEDFAKDMRLIFDNCLLFNPDIPENHDIRTYARELKDTFEEYFENEFKEATREAPVKKMIKEVKVKILAEERLEIPPPPPKRRKEKTKTSPAHQPAPVIKPEFKSVPVAPPSRTPSPVVVKRAQFQASKIASATSSSNKRKREENKSTKKKRPATEQVSEIPVISRKHMELWESFYAMALQRLVKSAWGAEYFSKPVLAVHTDQLFQEQYLQRVPNPMDLATIMNNLNQGGIYNRADELAVDVKLMFDNAFTFNDAEDPSSQRLRKKFMVVRNYWANLCFEGPGVASEVAAAKRVERESLLGNDSVSLFPPAFSRILKKITTMKNKPKYMLFWEPVDTTIYTMYLDVVSEPMDLKSIKKQLDDRRYHKADGIAAFAHDFRLIFDNCLAFNQDVPENAYVRDAAIALSRQFEFEFALSTCDALERREQKTLQAQFDKDDGKVVLVNPEKKRKTEIAAKSNHVSKYEYEEPDDLDEDDVDDDYSPSGRKLNRFPPSIPRTFLSPQQHRAPKPSPVDHTRHDIGFVSNRLYEMDESGYDRLKRNLDIAKQEALARVRTLKEMEDMSTEQALRRRERELDEETRALIESQGQTIDVENAFSAISFQLKRKKKNVYDMDETDEEPETKVPLLPLHKERPATDNPVVEKLPELSQIVLSVPATMFEEELPQIEPQKRKTGKGKPIRDIARAVVKPTVSIQLHQRILELPSNLGPLCLGTIVLKKSSLTEDIDRQKREEEGSIRSKSPPSSRTLNGSSKVMVTDLKEFFESSLQVVVDGKLSKSIAKVLRNICEEPGEEGKLESIGPDITYARGFLNQAIDWRVGQHDDVVVSPPLPYVQFSKDHVMIRYVGRPGSISIHVKGDEVLSI